MGKETTNLLELGRTLQVPNVQELAAAISSGKNSGNEIDIPERYVREEVEMDCGAFSADDADNDELPVIDLMKLLHDSEHPDEEELSRLGFACRDWGFFQLINHGIPEDLIQKTKDDITEFFKLPLKEREKIKQLPGKIEGYGQVFVHSQEQKLDWADVIALTLSPFHERDMRFWPANPPTFRDTFDRYVFEANKVAGCLCRLMAMNLGINPEILSNKFFSDQLLSSRINYYPPCKLASKVMGLTPHSDGGWISMLIQTNDVQGLQIKKNGHWYTIKPKPGAFIVNIGDMMEIITNGKYKSIEHRAVVNKDMERISIAIFYALNMDSMLYPLPELVNGDGELYRTISVKDFAKEYFSEKLNGKRALESMKLKKWSGRVPALVCDVNGELKSQN